MTPEKQKDCLDYHDVFLNGISTGIVGGVLASLFSFAYQDPTAYSLSFDGINSLLVHILPVAVLFVLILLATGVVCSEQKYEKDAFANPLVASAVAGLCCALIFSLSINVQYGQLLKNIFSDSMPQEAVMSEASMASGAASMLAGLVVNTFGISVLGCVAALLAKKKTSPFLSKLNKGLGVFMENKSLLLVPLILGAASLFLLLAIWGVAFFSPVQLGATTPSSIQMLYFDTVVVYLLASGITLFLFFYSFSTTAVAHKTFSFLSGKKKSLFESLSQTQDAANTALCSIFGFAATATIYVAASSLGILSLPAEGFLILQVATTVLFVASSGLVLFIPQAASFGKKKLSALYDSIDFAKKNYGTYLSLLCVVAAGETLVGFVFAAMGVVVEALSETNEIAFFLSVLLALVVLIPLFLAVLILPEILLSTAYYESVGEKKTTSAP